MASQVTSGDQAISRCRQTALAVVQSYNDWDIESIMAYRAPNCVHEILPKSLQRPARDNESYRESFSAMLPAFKDFHVTVLDIMEDASANKVAIWASSTAKTVIGDYANEYVLWLYFDETGEKLVRFLEFVDSAQSIDFFTRLRKHMVQQQSQQA